MKFSDIRKVVGDTPYIGYSSARYLYDLIIRERLTKILELGVAHGTATCYMAAALHEIGGGKITSVDLLEAKERFRPSPVEQLTKINLQHLVQIVYTQTGYSWFLHDEIRRLSDSTSCKPDYDLCIIDGPKNWTIDGGAFFMVDKILKENGQIIFDDYLWNYTGDYLKGKSETDGIDHSKLSAAERNTSHIKEVFDLLVMQHPNYSEFIVHPDDNWAIARKTSSGNKNHTIKYTESNRDILVRFLYFIKKHFSS